MKLVLPLILTALLFVGCEDNSSDDNSTSVRMFNDVGIIKYKNSGDEFITQGNNLLKLSSSEVYVLRSSGSGFSPGSPSDVGPGDYVDYYYYMSQIDFSTSPVEFSVIKVYVYDAAQVVVPFPTVTE